MQNFLQDDDYLTTRNIKTFKKSYKFTVLKNYLYENNIMFFYNDFIRKNDELILKNILQQNDIIFLRIKKKTLLNLLNKKEYIFLNNILCNNIIIIVSKKKNILFNFEQIESLMKIDGLFFIGSWIFKKLYRPSEYKKFLNLSKKTIYNNLLFLLNYRKIQIQYNISLINK